MITALPHKHAGMSLVEVMVVILVLAILMSYTLPFMRSFLVDVQIKTATEALLNGVQLARAEAIRRNANVRFTLGANTSWTVGCETPNNNLVDGVAICPASIQSRDATEGSTAVTLNALPVGANVITFNGLGLTIANTPASATITQLDTENTEIAGTSPRRILIQGSSVRQCNPAHNPAIPQQRVTAC